MDDVARHRPASARQAAEPPPPTSARSRALREGSKVSATGRAGAPVASSLTLKSDDSFVVLRRRILEEVTWAGFKPA